MIQFGADDIFLVAGASSGFGEASALLLNSLGATVIAHGRNEERLQSLAKRSSAPERCHTEALDLTADIDALPGWIKTLREKYGKLRGLLYCAGRGDMLPVRAQSASGMETVFAVNVMAGYQLARGFLDRRNNTGNTASIVLIASTSAFRENAGLSAYSASKGAILSLTRSLACEYVAQGIRVNAISPGLVPTPMTVATYPDLEERAAAYPLGPGAPDDVAKTAAFLLSDAARWITGQNIILDGGIGL